MQDKGQSDKKWMRVNVPLLAFRKLNALLLILGQLEKKIQGDLTVLLSLHLWVLLGVSWWYGTPLSLWGLFWKFISILWWLNLLLGKIMSIGL